MNTQKRWWQFRISTILLLMAVVAAFFGGRQSRQGEVDIRKRLHEAQMKVERAENRLLRQQILNLQSRMRPLGKGLVVDNNGTIFQLQDGRRVGIWGVDTP